MSGPTWKMPLENWSVLVTVATSGLGESRALAGAAGADGSALGLAIADTAGLIPPLVVASHTATTTMASIAVAPTTHWPRPRLLGALAGEGSFGGRGTGRHCWPSHHHRPSSENCAIP